VTAAQLTEFLSLRQRPRPVRRQGRGTVASRWASGAALALCAGLLPAAGCGRDPARIAPGDVVIGIETAPTTLDPRAATDAVSAQITQLVFQGLTTVGPSGRAEPELAESIETLDPLAIRFRLRSARFHDGEPLNAADVVATLRSLSTPKLRPLHPDLVEAIAAVDAEDEHTVRLSLREPFAPLLNALDVGIVPARCADGRSPDACLLGSGPFRFVDTRLDAVVLAAAETADPRPHIPGIVFRTSPDGVSRALALARGEIDLVQNAVEPDLLPWLSGRGLEVLEAPGSTIQYLGFNLRVPALADPRVRQALALAIDRRAIVQFLLQGTARPADELFPPGHWAHIGVEAVPFDPARARALLAEAAALPLHLTYKTSTVETRRRIAEAIAAFLGDVGVEVELRPLEWPTLYADIRRGSFEIFSLSWVGLADPDIYYSILHSSMVPPHGNNRGGFADPSVDAWTSEARRSLDPAERGRLYADVAHRVRADLPFVPLWWWNDVVVKTSALTGFTPRPSGDLRGLAQASWSRPPSRQSGG
jgi:peptide/nickel transport system substrate-binding protein